MKAIPLPFPSSFRCIRYNRFSTRLFYSYIRWLPIASATLEQKADSVLFPTGFHAFLLSFLSLLAYKPIPFKNWSSRLCFNTEDSINIGNKRMNSTDIDIRHQLYTYCKHNNLNISYIPIHTASITNFTLVHNL